MIKSQYRSVMVALMAGWIGGTLSGQIGQWQLSPHMLLAQWGILPYALLPAYEQAKKGFEVIDNKGKRRVLLDKFGLTFFSEDEQPQVTLNTQGPFLTLYEQNTKSVVQVSPSGPCVVRFTQSAEARFETLPLVTLPGGPKLGCGEKDGQRLWTVPIEERHEETGVPYESPTLPSAR
jgi:hypothetical protein